MLQLTVDGFSIYLNVAIENLAQCQTVEVIVNSQAIQAIAGSWFH